METHLKTTSLIVAIIFIATTLFHLFLTGGWLLELLNYDHEKNLLWRSILYPAIWILQNGALLAWFIMLMKSYVNDQIIKISSIVGTVSCAIAFAINLVAFINGYSEYHTYVMILSLITSVAAFALLAMRYQHLSSYFATLIVYSGVMLFFTIEIISFQFGVLKEIFRNQNYIYAVYFLVAAKGLSMAGFMYLFSTDSHLD